VYVNYLLVFLAFCFFCLLPLIIFSFQNSPALFPARKRPTLYFRLSQFILRYGIFFPDEWLCNTALSSYVSLGLLFVIASPGLILFSQYTSQEIGCKACLQNDPFVSNLNLRLV